jgi:hypothetical protein
VTLLRVEQGNRDVEMITVEYRDGSAGEQWTILRNPATGRVTWAEYTAQQLRAGGWQPTTYARLESFTYDLALPDSHFRQVELPTGGVQ